MKDSDLQHNYLYLPTFTYFELNPVFFNPQRRGYNVQIILKNLNTNSNNKKLDV